MKATYVQSPKPKKVLKFPLLARSKVCETLAESECFTVLFTSHTSGTVVEAGPNAMWSVGDNSDRFASVEFGSFWHILEDHESIVLKNS